MLESDDSKRMGDALAAIRAKLAKMRMESEVSLLRLAQTRADADRSAAARADDRPLPDARPPAIP